MQFEKTVYKRHSIREFTSQLVEPDLIKEIVTLAQRAPSWVNSQPWQVYCATGTSLEKIKQQYRQNDANSVSGTPDLAVMSRDQWAPREQANMKQWRHQIVHHFPIFEVAHTAMTGASENLYHAPAILFVTIPKDSPDWSIFDAGAFAQTLMLAAANRGLGSIVNYNSVRFPGVLRQVLGVPDEQRFMVGIALGYAVDEEINHFHSERLPLSKVLHFS